ncbi:MAG: hypothetical protein GY842_06370 [bacterium]|nr:hypothetical protein [bacterium]
MLVAVTMVSCALVPSSGCRPERPPERPAVAVEAAVAIPPPVPDERLTPLETVRRAHEIRRAGRLRELTRFVVPEQCEALADYLLAADELTAAGESLKARITEAVGVGSADAYDRTGVANALGPFSREVTCVSEHLTGDRAVVRISVGGRLPLEEVELVRRDDRWMIEVGAAVPELATELRKLARTLHRVADDMERRSLTSEQVGKELALRQRPILERIQKLTDDANPAESQSD